MAVNFRAHVRKRVGLTQMKLARVTGISQARISAWETGNIELSPRDVAKIAEAIRRHLDRGPQFKTADDLARALAPNFSREGDQPSPGHAARTSKD